MQKKLFNILIAVATAITLTACTPSKNNDEETAGMAALNRARHAMKEGNYLSAKERILNLRTLHPKALQARREAILTLDSVEMFLAVDSMQRAGERMYAEQRRLKELESNYTEHYMEYRKQEKIFNEAHELFTDFDTKVRFFRKKLEVDKEKLLEQARE
jgi:hypothetical protein